ncbi:histidine phosphatase family protein [uncultured Roseibium sp.]|uniref:histidine phosphatase family protein n=1 Tax=uncultured Roseibium sp. TaxID=1936171 RepID=UPI002598B3CE|nr:histidine phosphatase family protein [uncultured Roseibium sp.]
MTRRLAILVRHGDYLQRPNAPSALQPFPLTAKGKSQADAAGLEIAAFCKEENWHLSPVISCSRQLRAWQTAVFLSEGLRSELNLPAVVEESEELAERSVGALANLTVEEIEAIIAADPRHETLPNGWKSSSDYRLPFQGAESLQEAGQRVSDYLVSQMAALKETAGTVAKVFVGHGASFRHAAHRLGVIDFDEIARLSMHHARPVVLEVNDKMSWRRVHGEWKNRYPDEPATD